MNINMRTLTASIALLGLGGAVGLAGMPANATTTPPAQEGAAAAGQTEPGTGGAAAMQENGDRFGSFEAQRDSFAGTIAGEYSADELIGKDVVGTDDETVGTIADLLIDHEDRVDRVLLDVGGFLGMGQRTVAVAIEELQPPAEEDGDFRVSMTREQVEDLPEYERDDDGWFSR